MTIKRNHKGMTLVEVVVAMGVFSITFLGVTMCLAAALKLNNRAMLRDDELSAQQKVIEEHQAQGVALMDGHTINSDSIKFGTGGTFNMNTGLGKVDNVTQYHAIKTAGHGNDYNFELNGLSSPNNPLGNEPGDYDKTAGKYCIHVINDSSTNIDVKITIAGGTIYQGSYDKGYRNNASVYARTLPAKDASAAVSTVLPKELYVGYYNNGTISNGDVVVSITRNGSTASVPVSATSLSSQGAINLTVTDGSATPSVSWGGV